MSKRIDTSTDAEARLSALHRISVAIGSTLHVDDILVDVMAELTRILAVERSTLYLVDNERQELWSKVLQEDQGLREIRIALGQGLAGWVAASGEPLLIDDAYEDDRFDDAFDQASGFRTRCVMCYPVRGAEGAILGALQTLNKRDGGSFDDADRELVETVLAPIGFAIENAQLYESLLGRNRELQETQAQLHLRVRDLDLLYSLEQVIAQDAPAGDVLVESLLDQTAKITGDCTMLAVFEGTRTTEAYIAEAGGEAPVLREFGTPFDGLLYEILNTPDPVVVSGAELPPAAGQLLSRYVDDSCACFGMQLPDEALQHEKERLHGAVVMIHTDASAVASELQLKVLSLIVSKFVRGLVAAGEQQEARRADRLTSIGQMLSGVIHDFQTPMMIVQGYSHLLVGENTPADRAEFTTAIDKQVKHMSEMIGEVLAFARGERQLLRSQVDVQKVMAELEELVRREFEGREVALLFDVRYEGKLFVDLVKLKRAVLNLARNARQAMTGREDASFGVTVEGDAGDNVLMTFSDNGPGIPLHLQNRLFETFVTGKADGSGLGLAIVNEIVTAHEGRIAVDSQPNVGTTFLLTLPNGPTPA